MKTEVPIHVPRATYRLQFHARFTLRDAQAVVPYLAQLGVSHLYASPLLKAQPGSTHGYDVCDPVRINPEIGTEEDLAALVSALREHGMGLVLDIVPNHMGISGPGNRWWWDVLKHGPSSAFASYFDIDWQSPDPRLRGKVLVPVLGGRYDRVIQRGELRLIRGDAELLLGYAEHRFPLAPASLPLDTPWTDTELARLSSDPDALDALLQQQHYRLAFWRRGDTELNYRRFFSITSLAGLRVETPQVFSERHDRILEWHQRGWIDGLRVDHPDGLREPARYLRRLREAMPSAWIVVEKILEPGERLPAGWPVAGTTGYDFLNRVGGLFLDLAAEVSLTRFHAEFTGQAGDYSALVTAMKRRLLREVFCAEVNQLTRLLLQISARHWQIRDFTGEDFATAIVEVAAALPVYRTYATPDDPGVSEADAARIRQAVTAASARSPVEARELIGFVDGLLRRLVRGAAEDEFVARFQQLTGPAMAKGVEDTAFYCFNRFVALNEVGGDPGRFGTSIEDFHRACAETRRDWPDTMLATSTHDTKRSEDVRARLSLLSEIPDAWTSAVRRWSDNNEKFRRDGKPDRNIEYLFYQTLVGAWPLSIDRACAYMEKAAREAKQHTNWTAHDADYENALRDFVTGALNDRAFVTDLEQFVAPLIGAGDINSLAQILLKLAAPGVTDIYQGTEFRDLSLVDPDNRRPVDFAARRAALDDLEYSWSQGGAGIRDLAAQLGRGDAGGRLKQFLLWRTLTLRRAEPGLFSRGDHVPLAVTGPQSRHGIAFARTSGEQALVVFVPRFVLTLASGEAQMPPGPKAWRGTRIELPHAWRGASWKSAFGTDEWIATPPGAGTLPLDELLEHFPVALLHAPKRHGHAPVL